jgi:hypothetical protein
VVELPSLGKGTSTKGTHFSFDAVFLFLNRENTERALKLIMSHLECFGLTIHSRDKKTNEPTKTDAMYIPWPYQLEDTKDIVLDENCFFAYCTKFKYLGTTFTPELNGSNNVQLWIEQASKAFYVMNKNILRYKDISSKLWLRTYNTIIINLLLWVCESWALKAEDKRCIEEFHHQSIQRMLNITIYDVMEHHISNGNVWERMESYSMEQRMELRCPQWLEKSSHMGAERGPRKNLVAWTMNERPQGCHNKWSNMD